MFALLIQRRLLETMRSFTALALGLALTSPSSARVTNAEVGQISTSDSGSVVVNWLGRLFRRKAQVTCFEDEYGSPRP